MRIQFATRFSDLVLCRGYSLFWVGYRNELIHGSDIFLIYQKRNTSKIIFFLKLLSGAWNKIRINLSIMESLFILMYTLSFIQILFDSTCIKYVTKRHLIFSFFKNKALTFSQCKKLFFLPIDKTLYFTVENTINNDNYFCNI